MGEGYGEPDSGDAHCFYFSYGCVVTWGLSEGQEAEMVALLKAGHAQEPLSQEDTEMDDFEYMSAPRFESPATHGDRRCLAAWHAVTGSLAVACRHR